MKTKKIAKQALAAARCAQSVADSAYMQTVEQTQLQMLISEEVAKYDQAKWIVDSNPSIAGRVASALLGIYRERAYG